MRELGLTQSAKFTWDSSARQLLKIMKQLADHK
jgi:hypothetical protein